MILIGTVFFYEISYQKKHIHVIFEWVGPYRTQAQTDLQYKNPYFDIRFSMFFFAKLYYNEMDVEYLKSNDIDVDSSIELLGDLDMYNETLKDFLTESEDRLPKMDKFLKEKDASNYAILAHAMKSDSKYLGFKKLAELSLNHELEGKNNNVEYLENNYEELMTEVDRVIDIVKKYLGGK